ncbi:hypothetical protein N9N28_04505 [Rubripirellula amarantea]|uniref:Uncharacterized protein n=1 Tax=Rubripirellula amarantea TaxID=2527999 RepID=A0A5C5WI03_9BACT|nr:hypothetical protein [Rubripirellula amarantea]MDA8743877.1 hypothetical protein [Rubripirellula amarantea]TWT49633.1 hypothetical protein Pla22_48300 [Rubripirellula amarantea]
MNSLSKNRFVTQSFSSVSLVVGAIVLSALVSTTSAVGTNQEGPNTAPRDTSLLVDEKALDQMIKDRQAELAERQSLLTQAMNDLGTDHPSVAVMQQELDEVERQISIWSKPTETLVDIGDDDLRLLVVQLMLRIDQLESSRNEQQFQQQRSQRNDSMFRGGRPRSGPRPRLR